MERTADSIDAGFLDVDLSFGKMGKGVACWEWGAEGRFLGIMENGSMLFKGLKLKDK